MPLLKKINNSQQQKSVVLVAPLDWGLGHATRCIPLIRELISLQCEVIIAATGTQRTLLETEFPDVTFTTLPSYNIRYGASAILTYLKLMVQIPRLMKAINSEKKWLDNFISNKPVDLIISDNRYGLHSDDVYSVIVIHQLTIKTWLGHFADAVVRKLHYKYLERFDACWVPDELSSNNLAGELSHPKKFPATPVKYLGPLSRFDDREKTELTNDLLILLSGPEPQRTIFEKKILNQLQSFKGKAIIVRGRPGDMQPKYSMDSQLQVFNHLDAEELFRLINRSAIIVSRPGYSTVMDLVPLNKKCIFIPTPGQAEQLYLAKYLKRMGYCLTYKQYRFSIEAALRDAENFSPTRSSTGFSKVYKKILAETVG